jgi:hypothetical protein
MLRHVDLLQLVWFSCWSGCLVTTSWRSRGSKCFCAIYILCINFILYNIIFSLSRTCLKHPKYKKYCYYCSLIIVIKKRETYSEISESVSAYCISCIVTHFNLKRMARGGRRKWIFFLLVKKKNGSKLEETNKKNWWWENFFHLRWFVIFGYSNYFFVCLE